MYRILSVPADDLPTETQVATVGDGLTLFGHLAGPLFSLGGTLELRGPEDQTVISITVTGQGPALPPDWCDRLGTAMARAHRLPSRAEIAAAERWLAEERARGWEARPAQAKAC